MTYEFLVPKKGWTEEKFKKFLRQGANNKLREIYVKGRKNLLYRFSPGSEYNTRGTEYLWDTQNPDKVAERRAQGRRALYFLPKMFKVPRQNYTSLVESGLYYRLFFNSYELECIKEKGHNSNVKIILDHLEGNVQTLDVIAVR